MGGESSNIEPDDLQGKFDYCIDSNFDKLQLKQQDLKEFDEGEIWFGNQLADKWANFYQHVETSCLENWKFDLVVQYEHFVGEIEDHWQF